MKKTAVAPLTELINQFYGVKLLGQGAVCPEENQIVFMVQTEVGPLGFELQFFKDDKGWKALIIVVSPLFPSGKNQFSPYDLCKIDLEGYGILNQLQGKLEWTALFLSDEEGSKFPVLARTEILEPNRTFEEQDLSRIVSVIQMMVFDTVTVVPVLAAVSTGVHITSEDVLRAMSDAHDTIQ